VRGLALSIGLLASLTLTTAHAAPAASRHGDLPIEGVVTNPDWISKPSGEDVGRFYPPLPQLLGLAGRATMSCRVSELGILDGCSVSGEIPVGMGFGAATLQLAPYFHLRPMSLDGAPVGGAQVNIPVRFQVPEQDSPPSETPPTPRPTEAALALGRELVAAQEGAQGLERQVNASFEAIDRQYKDNGTPQVMAAVAAFRQAYTEGAASILERSAEAYAVNLTEAQLRQAVSFFESPGGRALMAVRLSEGERFSMNRAWLSVVRKDALKHFCAVVACLPEAGAPRAATPDQGLKP